MCNNIHANCNSITKRLLVACMIDDDFDRRSRETKELIVGRPMPNLHSYGADEQYLDYLNFIVEGKAKWRLMQADALLKLEFEK